MNFGFKKRFRLLVIVALYLGTHGIAAWGEEPVDGIKPEKLAAALELVNLNGYGQVFDGLIPLIVNRQITLLRAHRPGMKEGVYARFEEEFYAEMHAQIPQMLERLALYHARRMSLEDIHAVNAFSRTEAGRNVVEAGVEIGNTLMPGLVQEWTGGAAGQAAERVKARLVDQGLLL